MSNVTSAERVVQRISAVEPAELEDDIGELEIAEYVVFLLALDTYTRYLEETTGSETEDDLIRKGIQLVRLADRRHLAAIQEFLGNSLPTSGQKKMLNKAFHFLPTNSVNMSRRCWNLRTVLSRGGSGTMRAVFKKNKALQEVKIAIAASMMDDADAALDKFAAIPMRNSRLRKWIDIAAQTAGSGTFQNAVTVGSNEATDEVTPILTARTHAQGSSPTSEEHKEGSEKKDDLLLQVQQKAQESAQRAMAVSGEPDAPPAKSEVVGIATAAVVAAMTDPSNSSNIPAPLRRLDDEQRSAALTDGRVLVAAGAGAGKSSSLVARVEYLVKERRVFPSRILVTSFNTKAANELKYKIGNAVGGDALQQMSVGTMHALFRKFIGEYGTEQEKNAMGLGKDKGGFVQGGGMVARAAQRIWGECFPAGSDDERKVPKLKNVLTAKSKWNGNGISPVDAKAQARTSNERDAAEWYEMYEGLMGEIPNWKPPCGTSKGYESFMARWRPDGQLLGDFDSMMTLYLKILKREPAVKKTIQSMFDHIIVDEAQDQNQIQREILELMSEHITDGKDGKSFWIVGDDKQCIDSNTLIQTPKGDIKADSLKEGDEVLSYRNGRVVGQLVKKVWKSSWTEGFKITTESGAFLTMSPNHKLWATPLSMEVLGTEGYIVYLMYRDDLGFRVGVTNRAYEPGKIEHGSRIQGESGDKLWVLDVVKSKEEALTLETFYSLQYSVPMTVFKFCRSRRNPCVRRIEEIFLKFGKNGAKILEDKNFSFELPHWQTYSTARRWSPRRVVQFLAHRSAVHPCSSVHLEWLGEDLNLILQEAGFSVAKAAFGGSTEPRYRVRYTSNNYREAWAFAERLAKAASASINQRLAFPDEEPLRLITASGVYVGMQVPVLHEEKLVLENIISVEKVKGLVFLDLDVDDASNFFGGGILSHNSIYGFRGARPDLFTGLSTTPEWKTKVIRTNYRCQPEIVDLANKLIAHNEKQIPMEAVPSPAKVRGVGSVKVETPVDEAEAALDMVEEIKANVGAGEDVANNAILTRTNKEQHAFETACIIRGVPYARKGAASFLGSPETKAFLSYVQLATGDDFTKMQTALGEVINKPNRFFISPEVGATAVSDALSAYARGKGRDIKSVSPLDILGDRYFLTILAEKLTRTRSGFKFDKAIQRLYEIGSDLGRMKASSGDPAYTTKDLFDDILGMTGTAAITDSYGRSRFVEQSFRDSLKADIRDNISDDDDVDEDDTEGLGNVSFLYELAKKDPTDPEDTLTDPNTPFGFKAKMERYAARARDLRIDITKWDKEQEALPPEQRKAPPGVYIGTVHSCKGAQWKNVYVSMPAGKFPFNPPQKPGEPPPDPEEVKAEMEAERRLGYVALTRAAMNLTVICPSVVGGKAAGISQFVGEAGLKIGENVLKPGAPPKEEVPVTTVKTAFVEYEGAMPEDWNSSDYDRRIH